MFVSSKSDNKKSIDITTLLPEVFRSDVNKSLLDASFNKFLTKTDNIRVSGYIGKKNSKATVDRQLPEPSAHRQANQLAPVAYTTLGSETATLTFKGFLQQLELVGVDISQLSTWGAATRFNLVPPVNIDMLVNYTNYFWKPEGGVQTPSQHLTIENKCNKVQSKLHAYEAILNRQGETVNIESIDFINNALVVSNKRTDLFTPGFMVVTSGTTNANLLNKTWYVESSAYDSLSNTTSIQLSQMLALRTEVENASSIVTEPTAQFLGQWWLKYSVDGVVNQLYAWTGSSWLLTSQAVTAHISLTEQRTIYEAEADCACTGNVGGWDNNQWDDNQETGILWNTDLLAAISHTTEADWITANGTPQLSSVWYDISLDELKQFDGAVWVVIRSVFSEVLVATAGTSRWDAAAGCTIPQTNQWSSQNNWVHKSELTTVAGARRASAPILEYSAQTELNSWTKRSIAWKYRALNGQTFADVQTLPNRLELEPIKSYVAHETSGVWTIFASTASHSSALDANYTDILQPGTQIKIVDKTGSGEIYTVKNSVFRQITASDPSNLTEGMFVTVIVLADSSFGSPVLAGMEYESDPFDPSFTRIEPVTTSRGDQWRGYHVHWCADLESTTKQASSSTTRHPIITQDETVDPQQIQTTDGIIYLTRSFQELVADGSGVVSIDLQPQFRYTPGTPGYFAIVGTQQLRVYKNGVRQYGTYTEVPELSAALPDYTVINAQSLPYDVSQTLSLQTVAGIQLDAPLAPGDRLKIEVPPVGLVDAGLYAVPIRTLLSDTEFSLAVASGAQPVYNSVVTYEKTEQVKSSANQYPLFNVYNLITGSVTSASPLFTFVESSSAPVHNAIQKRVVVEDDGREFTFEQHLIDQATSALLCYRQITGNETTLWYSPLHRKLQAWDGAGYSSDVVEQVDGSFVVVAPYIGSEDPTHLHDVPQALWVNDETGIVYRRDIVNSVWTQVLSDEITINDADPTLQTIWKASDELYVPAYVDGDNNVVTEGDPSGDWEVVSQWKNNPAHANNKTIKMSQLVTHASSIISNQTAIPGLANGGVFALTQDQFNYGVGGTIKEHNGSFDSLISAINLTSVVPTTIIEFAKQQYELGLSSIYNNVFEVFSDVCVENANSSVHHIVGEIANRSIQMYEADNFLQRVYDDTSAQYNGGIKNWISTLPVFGFRARTTPSYARVGKIGSLIHHDGHRSQVSVSSGEIDLLARSLIADIQRVNPTHGIISSVQPSNPQIVFWYKPGVYRQLFKQVTTGVWEELILTDIVGGVLLEVETRLFNASSTKTSLVYDTAATLAAYTTAQQTTQQVLDIQFSQFLQYAAEAGIVTPLTNSTYTSTDAFTWNYASSSPSTPPSNASVVMLGSWQSLYQHWFGTPYPNAEPWMMQGYTSKPAWWDEEYKLPTGSSRVWNYDHMTATGMWENIKQGIIPVSRTYPSGRVSTGNMLVDGETIPQYTYVPVNISNSVVAGYSPDDLLPPYFNTSVAGVRSLFSTLSEVVAPSSDFTFGQEGHNEWKWRTSTAKLYDDLATSFVVDPVNCFDRTFGDRTTTVGKLNVSVVQQRVRSHDSAIFHGDLIDGSSAYSALGLNQWYVNYNRYTGHDTNANFEQLWTGWKMYQTYQTAGLLDTGSLEITNINFDVTTKDFDVVLANTGAVNQMWIDAFKITILSSPPSLLRYNTQMNWKFALNTLSPVPRNVEYYGSQVWPFVLDQTTNTFEAFKFNIESTDEASSIITVWGDQTPFVIPGVTVTISNSSSNDGGYTVQSSRFDASARTTLIKVSESIVSSVTDGTVTIDEYAHNWQTGDPVAVMSTAALPYPLEDGETYYVIRVSDTQIQLANSPLSASTSTPIDITSNPPGGHMEIGKIASSYVALGGGVVPSTWYHFELNKSDIRTIYSSSTVYGMQSLLSIIDGYKEIQTDAGVRFNDTSDLIEYDADTNLPVTWNIEQERFIEWAYTIRSSKIRVDDRYSVEVVSISQNTLKFTGSTPAWSTGQSVVFHTSGILPAPLLANTTYFLMATDDPLVFKVSVTSHPVDPTTIVDLTDTGSGQFYISSKGMSTAALTFELNPCRNHVWINTPQGMLSNILTGPYEDIRVTQTIHDQYGRSLTSDKLSIYRHDKQSRISVRSEIPNDVELTFQSLPDPYNYLHMGGGHIIIQGVEHVVRFNDYTVSGELVYDPFLGLAATRFDLDYYESRDYLMRPTLGGYYLSGDSFVRNMEGQLEDLRQCYDITPTTNTSPFVARARQNVGFVAGDTTFLDLINVSSKSHFMFYRGMIQSKGSADSINAFINSRKFIGAEIDEFWMYKAGEFGEAASRNHPQLKLYASDGGRTTSKFKFSRVTDTDYNVLTDLQQGFETISLADAARWVNHPEQRADLASPLFFDAAISNITKMLVTYNQGSFVTMTPAAGERLVDVWADISLDASGNATDVVWKRWTGAEWVTTSHAVDVTTKAYNLIIRLSGVCDGIRILHRRHMSSSDMSQYTTSMLNEVDAPGGVVRINAEVVKLPSTVHTTVAAAPSSTIEFTDPSTASQFVVGDVVRTSSNGFAAVVDVRPADNTIVLDISCTTSTITTMPGAGQLVVAEILPAFSTLASPSILDVKSHTRVASAPLWHPAVGIHHNSAMEIVDVQNDVDPARYSSSISQQHVSDAAWAVTEVGTVWLDTSSLKYVPYYDDKVMTSYDHTIASWGKLQPWGAVKLYKWVESIYDPDEWVSIVASQQGDLTINESDRITGTPRRTVFSRSRIIATATPTGILGEVTSSLSVEVGSSIILTSNGNMPTGVATGSLCDVTSVVGSTLTVEYNGQLIDFTGSSSLRITQPFTDDMWTKYPLISQRVYGAWLTTQFEPFLVLNSQFLTGDVVDVYINGKLAAEALETTAGGVSLTGTGLKVSDVDVIDVVRPVHVVTEAERTDSLTDRGTSDRQWTDTVEATSVITQHPTSPTIKYYFWVESSAEHIRGRISSIKAAEAIEEFPGPYIMLADPRDDEWERGYDVPHWDVAPWDQAQYLAKTEEYVPSIFYRRAMIHGLNGIVTGDDRYVLEFVRDHSLRFNDQSKAKNKHEKWLMIRRNQSNAIDQSLWIKLTESLMKCKYDNLGVRLPSYDREHYDLINGTSVSYGLGSDQVFVDQKIARDTVVGYLLDLSHDFRPVDISVFFDAFPATTDEFWADPAAIKNMCDYIYDTFDASHINGIWFNVLLDALSNRMQYRDILKTSWLALYGIRILNVNNQFDE